MKKKKTINIEFRLLEIKKSSHFENDFSELGITEKNIVEGDLGLGVKHILDKKEGTITIIVNVIYRLDINGEIKDLFGIEALFKFEVKSFKTHFTFKDDKVDMPDQFIANLLSISISGTRGMLAVLNTTPAYQKLILPIINPDIFIKMVKQECLNEGEKTG